MRNIESILSIILAMVIMFAITICIWAFAPIEAHAYMSPEAYAYAEERAESQEGYSDSPEEYFHIVYFPNGKKDYAIHTDYDAKEDVWQFTLYHGGLYVTAVIPSNGIKVVGACGEVTPEDWLNGQYDGHDCPW